MMVLIKITYFLLFWPTCIPPKMLLFFFEMRHTNSTMSNTAADNMLISSIIKHSVFSILFFCCGKFIIILKQFLKCCMRISPIIYPGPVMKCSGTRTKLQTCHPSCGCNSSGFLLSQFINNSPTTNDNRIL